MNERRKISVAMAVHNSERFIQEQLESFVRQTRLPDELVVSDDASTDRTVEIVQEFTAHAPFEVRIVRSSHRIGMSEGFERAFRAAEGTFIFPSDCDDIWYPEKISKMERLLMEHPNAGIALANADMVDQDLQPLKKTEWEHLHFRPSKAELRRLAEGRGFNVRLPTLGHSLAFRASLRSIFLPFPRNQVFFGGWWDYFLAWTIVCSGAAGIAATPERLVAWRRHSGAASAPKTRSRLRAASERWHSRLRAGPAALPDVVERLESLSDVSVPNPWIRAEALAHWRSRCTLPSSIRARFSIIAKELIQGRYHRFSKGVRTAARDLLLVA